MVRAYRRFVVHEAVVAEAAGADLFAWGAGLTSTEEQKNEWKQAIAAVRLATGAALTYAVFAPTATYVPFWDGLDAIGVELVDPLPRGEKVTESALLDAARAEARPLADCSRAGSFRGKPVARHARRDRRRPGDRRALSRPDRSALVAGRLLGEVRAGKRRGGPEGGSRRVPRHRRGRAVSALLDAAVDAAVAGGRVLSANWRNLPHGSVEEKKKNDFVTLADRESEERIVGVLRGRFPGDAFLAEEGGTHGGGEAARRAGRGSSIRSTARPTSSPAFRSGASRSPPARATTWWPPSSGIRCATRCTRPSAAAAPGATGRASP